MQIAINLFDLWFDTVWVEYVYFSFRPKGAQFYDWVGLSELWTMYYEPKNYGYLKLVMKAYFTEREIGIFFVDNEPKPSDALFVRPLPAKRSEAAQTNPDSS